MRNEVMTEGNVIPLPTTNLEEVTSQRSYAPYLMVGGGICVCAGVAVGVTMLILYVWAVPSPPPPPVTIAPKLDYPALYLRECSRSIESSYQPSGPVHCKLGVPSIGTGVTFTKASISSDYEYIKLANNLYFALLSIEYIVSNDSSHHCPSSTNIIENICDAQAGNVTCNKVLSDSTYLYEKLFTNLTIHMMHQLSGTAQYNDTTNSLSVSSADSLLSSQCQGNVNACMTGIILNTLLGDTLCNASNTEG